MGPNLEVRIDREIQVVPILRPPPTLKGRNVIFRFDKLRVRHASWLLLMAACASSIEEHKAGIAKLLVLIRILRGAALRGQPAFMYFLFIGLTVSATGFIWERAGQNQPLSH